MPLPQTSVVNQFLGRFSTETMATKTITFSSLTTPQIFQVCGREDEGPAFCARPALFRNP